MKKTFFALHFAFYNANKIQRQKTIVNYYRKEGFYFHFDALMRYQNRSVVLTARLYTWLTQPLTIHRSPQSFFQQNWKIREMTTISEISVKFGSKTRLFYFHGLAVMRPKLKSMISRIWLRFGDKKDWLTRKWNIFIRLKVSNHFWKLWNLQNMKEPS